MTWAGLGGRLADDTPSRLGVTPEAIVVGSLNGIPERDRACRGSLVRERSKKKEKDWFGLGSARS